ncbi:hypothetical protein B0H21DRAFT_782503 [Amylocystis lapponica]|nr:hypothetical protein B0H21DRAFT_782503 [Amylocystis lapponica]
MMLVKDDEVPLDDGAYNLNGEELAFFKSQTGIQDEAALKDHVVQIQLDAYEIYPYTCIRRFAFTKPKISRLPAYAQGAIFLDIGCCYVSKVADINSLILPSRNDIRKAVADGFPIENALGSDLQAARPTPAPALPSLTSLAPLRGHVAAIHASAFFHLFDEAKQAQLARALAGLLAPEPGALIFGAHGGRPEKGVRVAPAGHERTAMFCHSPESFAALWDGEVFKRGTVRVEAVLKETERRDVQGGEDARSWHLVWSVTRL